MCRYFPTPVLHNIFTHIQHAGSQLDLFSCMLVNRHWCRNVVSFYWCEVISNPTQLETIISLLTPEDRKLIDIDLPEAKIPPAFPYPAFLKTLDIGDLYQTIGTWLVQRYQTDFYHETDIYNYRRQIAFAILLVYQRHSPNIQKLVIEEDAKDRILLEDMRIQSGADVLMLCQHPIRPLFKNVEILKISSQSYTFDLLNSLADTCHNVVSYIIFDKFECFYSNINMLEFT